MRKEPHILKFDKIGNSHLGYISVGKNNEINQF